jgi:hypothetical protein
MIAFGCSIVAAIPMQAAASAAPVDFNRDILPILSNNCFKCHGPDDHERKAKLRLDTHAGVLGSGKSGAIAVVPGQSAQSELILRITSTIEDEAMPPLDSNKKLTPAQIDVLKRWVDQGAPWGKHEHVAISDRRIIVSITSGMGSIADSSGGYYAYRSSKAALNMTMHNFALDLKSRQVIAVAINPGWVQTDMGGASAPTSPEASIEAMLRIFDQLTLDDSGNFLNYRGGTYPW